MNAMEGLTNPNWLIFALLFLGIIFYLAYMRQRETKRILQKAAELEIPLKKQDLNVSRTESTMIITASYEQPIDLKVTTYVYRFSATEKAPLF